MPHPNAELASELHRAADLLADRSLTETQRQAALELVRKANNHLDAGTVLEENDKLKTFISQMIVQAGAPEVETGDIIKGFDASPYSGEANPLRPQCVEYRAIESGVHAVIRLGPAFEGRPGRAHGGATAAIFDDVMGAVQRVIGRSGYTRSLTINYYAPLPIDVDVDFIATYIDNDLEDRFTVEGTARHGDRTVAAAVGVFTEVSLATFGAETLET